MKEAELHSTVKVSQVEKMKEAELHLTVRAKKIEILRGKASVFSSGERRKKGDYG